jgi:hypothetical protein
MMRLREQHLQSIPAGNTRDATDLHQAQEASNAAFDKPGVTTQTLL